MSQWITAMLDLETMGLPPDGAIASIGCCFFDMDRQEIGPTFKKNINLATAVRDGGTINPSTVCWWLRQSDAARAGVLADTYDIRQVLTEFGDFIRTHSREQDVLVYGNGAEFDVTLLNSAYLRAGIPVPWRPFSARCFRTIRNMFPSIEYNPEKKPGVAHDSLDDAIFQAQHLFKIKHRSKPHAQRT